MLRDSQNMFIRKFILKFLLTSTLKKIKDKGVVKK